MVEQLGLQHGPNTHDSWSIAAMVRLVGWAIHMLGHDSWDCTIVQTARHPCSMYRAVAATLSAPQATRCSRQWRLQPPVTHYNNLTQSLCHDGNRCFERQFYSSHHTYFTVCGCPLPSPHCACVPTGWLHAAGAMCTPLS